jgi:hypothetical protein
MSLQIASEVFRSKDLTAGGGAPGEFGVAVIASSPVLRMALNRYSLTPAVFA